MVRLLQKAENPLGTGVKDRLRFALAKAGHARVQSEEQDRQLVCLYAC